MAESIHPEITSLMHDYYDKLSLSKLWFEDFDFKTIQENSRIFNDVNSFTVYYVNPETKMMDKKYLNIDLGQIKMPSFNDFNKAYKNIEHIIKRLLKNVFHFFVSNCLSFN
jgi:hypothetical protein